MLYCIGCKLSDGEPESKKTWDIIDVSEFEKLKVFYFLKHFDKSVIVSFFDLPLTNTKIINQYNSPYTSFRIPTILWVQHYNLQVYDKK